MRVLWVKMGGLWPLNTGGRQRTFQILSELSQRHRVTVVTTDGPGDDPDRLARELDRCERVVSIPYSVPKVPSGRFVRALARSWLSRYPVDLWKWRVAAVSRFVNARLSAGDVDVVVADFLFAMPNMPAARRVPLVFFAHNVEHLIWQRLCEVEPRLWRRLLLAIEWRKLRRCEFAACRHADLTLAVSPEDRDRLAAGAPGARVVAVPTGVDTSFFRPAGTPEVPGRLVFSGSMDWYPNEDAVVYFTQTILPLIRLARPDVSFTIVGRNPSAAVRALADVPGVHVTGTIDDVRPDIDAAALYIVPLRVGGGTRLKIFEALAMAKAVLSTTIGAEGLGLVPGAHVAIADDPDAFAQQAIALLNDPAGRLRLGAEGRRLVEERYGWSQVAREFDARVCEVVTDESCKAQAPCRALVS